MKTLVVIALFTTALSGCAVSVGPTGNEDAGGPTWIDSSPAILNMDAAAVDAGPEADTPTDASSMCTRIGSCGGSWNRYECPEDIVPSYESHCSRNHRDADVDAGPMLEWCCYGSQAP